MYEIPDSPEVQAVPFFHAVADLVRSKAPQSIEDDVRISLEGFREQVQAIHFTADIIEGMQEYFPTSLDKNIRFLIFDGVNTLVNLVETEMGSRKLTGSSLVSDYTDGIGLLTHIALVLSVFDPDKLSYLDRYLRTSPKLLNLDNENLNPMNIADEVFDRADTIRTAMNAIPNLSESEIILKHGKYPRYFNDEHYLHVFQLLGRNGNALENLALMASLQSSILFIPPKAQQLPELFIQQRRAMYAFTIPMMSVLDYYNAILWQIYESTEDSTLLDEHKKRRAEFIMNNPSYLTNEEIEARALELQIRILYDIHHFLKVNWKKFILQHIYPFLGNLRLKSSASLASKSVGRTLPEFNEIWGDLLQTYMGIFNLRSTSPFSLVKFKRESREWWNTEKIKDKILDVYGVSMFVNPSFFDQSAKDFDRFARDLHKKEKITIIHINEEYLNSDGSDPIFHPRFYKAYAIVTKDGNYSFVEIRFFNIEDYPMRGISHYFYKAGIEKYPPGVGFCELAQRIRSYDISDQIPHGRQEKMRVVNYFINEIVEARLKQEEP